MSRMKSLPGVFALVLSLCAASNRLHAESAASTATELGKKVGVLNVQNCEATIGLFTDGFLNRYKNGEWEHEICEAPPETKFHDPDFMNAASGNGGRYAIGKSGEVVDIKTGKQPEFAYGPPFPDIDP